MIVKDLIEALQKLDPTTRLWVQYADKSELAEYFVEGCEINDTDWEEFCSDFSGDWEYVDEYLSDLLPDNNKKNVYCDSCSLYDYECITDEDEQETYCRHCGEEQDLLNG
jgi:hypothetical protein